MYKYMTWSSGKYFEGNQLLERNQIARLLSVFKSKKQDTFVTIQDYTEGGDIIGCPLYFDIDAPSLLDAHEETMDLYYLIEELYGVSPVVWFSGSKGFHLIAPLYIRHPRCHEIVKIIRDELFGGVDCDDSVYRTRSMLRCENTWNIKGETYKIHVPRFDDRRLEDIIEMAKFNAAPLWRDTWRMSDLDITEYVARLPEFKPVTFEGNLGFSEDMMPCLNKLWSAPVPPEGTRHDLAYVMVRHCYRSGLDREQAQALFATHPFWSTVEARDYDKIISSVYNTGRAAIGCKNNQMLLNECVNFCKFNSNIDMSGVSK